ncbi:MAG: YVTN family beta-propeller protein [Myxococcota bacterium]|jgi:YVTN family beta-propeller protein
MRILARTFLLLLLLQLAAPSADARRIMIRNGVIPDDLREVMSGSDGPVRDLKRFEHRPWLTGASIALLPGEKRFVVADTDNRAVVVVDVATSVVLKRIAVGRAPERLVVAPNGRVFVTNRGSRSISLVDPDRGVEVRSVEAGVEPYGIALSPDAKTLLVTASASSELLAFDAKSLALRFRVELEDAWPAAVAFHPDGRRAFVTHFYGGNVDIVDMRRQRVTGSLKLPTKDSGLPGRLQGRFDPPRKPNLALAAVVSAGGTRLHVAHTMANTGDDRGVSVSVGGYGLGAPSPLVATVSTFDLESGELMRPKVDFSKGARGGNHSGVADQMVQQMSQPVGIAVDPVHARLFMVGMGSDRVMALDASSSDPITEPMQNVLSGKAPKGIAVSSDGRTALIHNSQDYAVSVVDLTASAMQSPGNWQVKPTKSFEIAKNPLPEDVARGRRLFTYALDARISGVNRFACASCHPDGRQDGLTWHVSVGPRQTPILADRLAGTGPFNWLGTEDKLEQNVHMTVKRLGGSALKPEEVADLAKYMKHYMPSLDNPHRQADVAAGRDLFNDKTIGCSGCHTPDTRFTDGAKHEVGTTSKIEFDLWKRFGPKKPGGPRSSPPPNGDQVQTQKMQMQQGMPTQGHREAPAEAPVAFNTPALRHLWASAPYLHDGSVKSIRELLTTGNKGNRMGKTSHLSSRQVDQLVAYLRSL